MENLPEKKGQLFLFTVSFPYGTGENFISNELLFLSSKFEKIFIFPLESKGDPKPVPANCEVIDLFTAWSFSGASTFFRHPVLCVRLMVAEFFSVKKKSSFFRLRNELRSHLLQCISRSELLETRLRSMDTSKAVLYTFWFNDWATMLALLKRKKTIRKYITRVHGYDLYHFRRKEGIVPFRNFQLKHVSGIFAVSQHGGNYLKQEFPRYADKVHVAHLGVFDKGINPMPENREYVMVSCANVIPVKRVLDIYRALMHTQTNLHWIHFGHGPLMDELKQAIGKLPATIKVTLKGNIPNAELIGFYKTSPVSFFVHTSESEGGVPVAIQEAVSFGIPVIAVGAGGVPEIVNENTGTLIPEETYSPVVLANEIDRFLESERNTRAFREKVKAYWCTFFDAEQNFGKFHQAIIKNTNN